MPACCVPAPTFCVLSLQVSFSGRHGPLRDLFVPSVASLDVCSVSLLLMQTGGKRSLHLSVLASGHVMSVFRRGNNLNIYHHVFILTLLCLIAFGRVSLLRSLLSYYLAL